MPMPFDFEKARRLLIKKCGSVTAAAEQLDMPRESLARILSGRSRNPGIDTMEKVAGVLECNVKGLIKDVESRGNGRK